MLQRGDTFGSYRIVARLKAGGMAQLYLARREGVAGFSRPVALKVIHGHLARQDEFVRMFIDEATLSSKIHDPNVVHVEDLGNVGGTLFLSMEYVHGVALANVLKAARAAQRRLAPSVVAHIGAQIASGLHAAHDTTDESGNPLGIVHRDVSPQNVLLAFKGHVKVIDFGVAKAYGKRHETEAFAIQGKLGYMAPEQARSEPIDRRADVYALGVVLWEMLAGRRLFEAENELVLVERVRNPRVERPSTVAPGIPPALDDAVMHLLAPHVDARPKTALDVKRLLLDAVPEARSVEAHDVAALMRALVPNDIETQNRLLASVDGDVLSSPGAPPLVLERPSDPSAELTADLTTTERRVDPLEALHHLTVPAVVVPQRSSNGTFALIAGLALLAGIVAMLFASTSPRAHQANDTAVFPPAPPLPARAEAEASAPPPPTSSSSPPPAAPVSASPVTSASTSAPASAPTSKPRSAPVPAKKKPSGPRCQKVGDLDLCE